MQDRLRNPRRRLRNNFLASLTLLTTAGIVARVVAAALRLRYDPGLRTPAAATDMYTYQQAAKALLAGTYDFEAGFYYQPFYYTIFLPLVYWAGNDGPWALILAQSAVGGATIWVTGMVAAAMFGRTAGVVAAFLAATSRSLIWFTPVTLIATVQAFWIVALVLLALRAYRKNTTRTWALVGLVHGLAVITRGNALLFAPFVIGLILRARRRKGCRAFVAMAAYGVLFLAPQLPYTFANYHVHGRWVGPSTAGPAVLALGNTPEAPPGGREPEYGAGPMEYPRVWHEWMQQHETEGTFWDSVYGQVWKWISDEPLAYLELKFRMLLLFWHQMEVPNNISMTTPDDVTGWHRIALNCYPGFLPVGSLALAGIILATLYQRHRTSIRFAVVIVTVYCFATILFYILARFRVPIIPMLCVFAGYAFVEILRVVRRFRLSGSIGVHHKTALAALFVGFVTVAWGYDIYRYQFEAAAVRFARPEGVQLQFGHEYVLKDHGPFSFGGWTPVSSESIDRLHKIFVLPQETQNPEMIAVRLAVYSDTGATVTFQAAGGTPFQISRNDTAVHTIQPGLQWIETNLHFSDHNDRVKKEIDIEFRIRSLDGNMQLFIDQQRDYGRTRCDVTTGKLNGELVAEISFEVVM